MLIAGNRLALVFAFFPIGACADMIASLLKWNPSFLPSPLPPHLSSPPSSTLQFNHRQTKRPPQLKISRQSTHNLDPRPLHLNRPFHLHPLSPPFSQQLLFSHQKHRQLLPFSHRRRIPTPKNWSQIWFLYGRLTALTPSPSKGKTNR